MTRLIDGNALIELINGGYDLDFDEVPETKRELLRMIMEQPTVDAEPVRHGRWEKVRGHQMVRRCSECGDIMPRDRAFIHYIYCGHCGAKMGERKEE